MKTLPQGLGLVLLGALLCISCSPFKAYPGPVRAPGELATLHVATEDRAAVQLQQILLDTTEVGLLFHKGIELLPGEHSIKTNVSSSNGHCRFATELCVDPLYVGSCNGAFTARAGRTYDYTIKGLAQNLSLAIIERESGRPAGFGSCTVKTSLEALLSRFK